MSHTYSQNVLHVVFSTKDRQKTISPEFQPRLWAYVAGVCQKLEILVHALGGTEDHIHLLIQVPPVCRWPRRFSPSNRILHDGQTRRAIDSHGSRVMV